MKQDASARAMTSAHCGKLGEDAPAVDALTAVESMADNIERQLVDRLGPIHARQRLGIEQEHEQQVFGGGLNFFHPENWYSTHALIAWVLRLTGLYARGHRNTLDIRVRHNEVVVPRLGRDLDGFTILHLTDLHFDMNPSAMAVLKERVRGVNYDICVLTGDYRAQTFGPFDAALEALGDLVTEIPHPVFGVLGNHDTVRMLPGIELTGVRMLMNEHAVIRRGRDEFYLVGVDDPHYYRVDNVVNAAAGIPTGRPSVLLSHTPEIYRQAAHAGFDLMLCGHTHGGQICLPGGVPLTLDSRCPRYMGSGAWQYHEMQGFTCVGAGTCIVPVRFNCPPEIVLHHLRRA